MSFALQPFAFQAPIARTLRAALLLSALSVLPIAARAAPMPSLTPANAAL